MIDFSEARNRMVERQIARRNITDPHVLHAVRSVARERFLPEALQGFAYDDGALPIAEGQTISQPYIVGLMLEAAAITPVCTVLEIGTGSGYAAAMASDIAAAVYTVERHASLGEAAGQRLAALGYSNIEVRIGDGTLGWPEAAPFDAILVADGSPMSRTCFGCNSSWRTPGHSRRQKGIGPATPEAHANRQ